MHRYKSNLPKLLKISFFLIPVLALFALVVFLPKLIQIKKITCQSQFGPCSTQIQDELKKAENSSLDFSKKTVREVLSGTILVKDYLVQFKLPNNLSVDLIERNPKFALFDEAQGKFVLVDKEGLVVVQVSSSNLPRLVMTDELPAVGTMVPREILYALEIVSALSRYYVLQSAVLESETLSVKIEFYPSLIFPLDGDKKVLLGAANLILSRLKSEDENLKLENASSIGVVDLRFKNPVLKKI